MKIARLKLSLIVALAGLGALSDGLSQEFTFSNLKLFGDPDLTTGTNPIGCLALGKDGRLYGTAGGTQSNETVFAVNSDGSGLTVIHRLGVAPGDTGYYANGLMAASDGVLYGTTRYGGSQNDGTVFKVNGDGSGYEILWNFQGIHASDGQNPRGCLIEGTDGALYGTTYFGGAHVVGSVFRINKDGSGYSIIKSMQTHVPGGVSPTGLIQASDGALYGVAYNGGSGLGGTIFKLNLDGSGFAEIWSFKQNSTNGYWPESTLLEGSDGSLYGSTTMGGALSIYGSGTIFKINKDGTGFTVLYSFLNSIDDANDHRLAEGKDGALYGTRATGGAFGQGGVFRLNKDGTGFTSLHDFSGTNGDGALPFAGLTAGTAGEFYGSTIVGGKNGAGPGSGTGYGTLFALRPGTLAPGLSINSDGHAHVTFVGQSGKSYSIQAAAVLPATAWATLGSATATASGQIQFDDGDATNHPARFYRTLQQ